MMFRSMGCLKSWALVFRRRSVRVYYVIPCQRHLEALRACTADFLQSRWGCDGHFELVESDRGGASMDKSSSATKPTSLKQHLEDVSATSILESSPMRLELDQPDRAGIQRGMRLFHYLADRANDGDAVGISYGRFIAYIHGGTDFRQIAHRNYLPSDSGIAVRIALSITEEAGGRVVIFRADRSIQAGMDTFIWNGARPFDRPPRAWLSRFHIPYTREDWLVVFPSGARQMISPAELETLEQRK